MTVFSMLYRDATKRSASQTIACIQTCIFRVENVWNAYLHYEQTVPNAIHYTSNVNLLQESVNFAVTYRNRAHFTCSIYVYCTRNQAHIMDQKYLLSVMHELCLSLIHELRGHRSTSLFVATHSFSYQCTEIE
jgi:hypothetical protein